MQGPSRTWNLGKSIEGRPLEAQVFAPKSAKSDWPWILLLGGVHGDEVEGVWLMQAVRERWKDGFPGRSLGAIVFAQVNPDGAAKSQRWNARGVDLNRNLPSRDWTAEIKNPKYPPGPSPASEPENQVLVELIKRHQPTAILSAHSFLMLFRFPFRRLLPLCCFCRSFLI